ncbi:MAG: hypothetical protein KKF44_05425 [Nanoarchaeota archaeon]|nr:hypothetical protein [Nanoarchaeota archaeon]
MKKKDYRMENVEKWAMYVREHDDKDWSKQQKVLIDSQIKNAKNIKLSRKQVDYIKTGRK